MSNKITVSCIKGNVYDSADFHFLETAIFNATKTYLQATHEKELLLEVSIGCDPQKNSHTKSQDSKGKDDRESELDRINQYVAQSPIYTFERLIINAEVMDELKHAINLFKHHDLIYNVWGLKANNPFPVVALNFWGPPGTGKTLAAHAIASYLNKKIILASYAQIESMYHGEGPKNVEAIFKAAEQQDAILFIDEADSLLSKRLTNVQQGSENAINSMRSQILICLEKFNGIVIFATNLVSNYDRAFESRVRSIKFNLPDEKCRREIWKLHLPATFPQDSSVNLDELAKIDDICGREIRNAVQNVAEKMADEGIAFATYDLLASAIDKIKKSRFKKDEGVVKKETIPLDEQEKKVLTEAMKEVEAKHKSEECSA